MDDRFFPIGIVVFTAFASLVAWYCAVMPHLPLR
jgi:hypothetical protein